MSVRNLYELTILSEVRGLIYFWQPTKLSEVNDIMDRRQPLNLREVRGFRGFWRFSQSVICQKRPSEHIL